jgi:Ca2+/Na+ antiporter
VPTTAVPVTLTVQQEQSTEQPVKSRSSRDMGTVISVVTSSVIALVLIVGVIIVCIRRQRRQKLKVGVVSKPSNEDMESERKLHRIELEMCTKWMDMWYMKVTYHEIKMILLKVKTKKYLTKECRVCLHEIEDN